MRAVKLKPIWELLWAKEWRMLKIIPMNGEADTPLTHKLLDILHKASHGMQNNLRENSQNNQCHEHSMKQYKVSDWLFEMWRKRWWAWQTTYNDFLHSHISLWIYVQTIITFFKCILIPTFMIQIVGIYTYIHTHTYCGRMEYCNSLRILTIKWILINTTWLRVTMKQLIK